MIIANSQHFVFCRVPRTGSNSIVRAIRPNLKSGDIEYIGHPEYKTKDAKHQQIVEHDLHVPIGTHSVHVAIRDIPDYAQHYWKFGFCRNPFGRFLSVCIFMAENTQFIKTNIRHPTALMEHLIERIDWFRSRSLMFYPQTHFLTGADYVGRFEDIQESFSDICTETRMQEFRVPCLNVGKMRKGRSYTEFYTPRLVEQVAYLYQDDLLNYDYRYGDE